MKDILNIVFILLLQFVSCQLYAQNKGGFRINANSVDQKGNSEHALDSVDIVVVSLPYMDTLIVGSVQLEYKGSAPEGSYKLIAKHWKYPVIENEFIVLDNKVTFLTLKFKHDEGLIGTWKLKTVRDSSGKKCSGIKKYNLEINDDSSYYMLFGGTSWVEGTWAIEKGRIKLDAKSVADPCMEWTSKEEFNSFVLTEDGTLIIDLFICGTTEGRSYFKRKH